ncbi:hypothetical protein [Pedobacter panaciterrae]
MDLLNARKEIISFRKKTETQAKQVLTEAKELDRKVNEKGAETVLFNVTDNHAPANNYGKDTDIKGVIDTAALALEISNNKLKEVLVVNANLQAKNIQLQEELDSTKRKYYTWAGNGLTLKFTPPYDANAATADINGSIGLTAALGYKKKWLFGKEQTLLSISSDNPFIKIGKVNYIGFDRYPNKFGLRLQASANYNPQTSSIGFGPSARLDIDRLSIQGNYAWYPDSEQWNPSIYANYDIVRF